MKTEELIGMTITDAARRTPPRRIRPAALALAFVSSAGTLHAVVHVRPDLAAALGSWSVRAKRPPPLNFEVAAGGAALRPARPGAAPWTLADGATTRPALHPALAAGLAGGPARAGDPLRRPRKLVFEAPAAAREVRAPTRVRGAAGPQESR